VVAVLLPNLANPIFAETAQGLAETVQSAGFELLMTSTSYSLEREEGQLRAVLGWRPAAVIVTGRRHSAESLALWSGARRSGTPVVEIWDCPDDTRHPPVAARKPASATARFVQVGLDHTAIGQAMAQHLLDTGPRHMACVDSGVAEDYRAHERGQAFALAARQAGAQVAQLTAQAGDPFDAGRQALSTLLDSAGPHADVTAAAFANDQLASGALLEAVERGVPVPQRLAPLGFGDFAWSRQLRPSLSSVWLPRVDICQLAAQAVLQMLQQPQAAVPRAAPLGFALRIRQSTRAGADDTVHPPSGRCPQGRRTGTYPALHRDMPMKSPDGQHTWRPRHSDDTWPSQHGLLFQLHLAGHHERPSARLHRFCRS
jgi:LacI family gluconate utilization system Gnt-I transcriptional repressor